MKHSFQKILTLALSVALLLPLGACTDPAGTTETRADTAAATEQTEALTAAVPETEPAVETPPYAPDFRVTAYVVGGIEDLSSFRTEHMAQVTDVIMIGGGTPRIQKDGSLEMDPNFALYVSNLKEATKGLPIRVHVNLLSPEAENLREGASWDEQMHNIARQYQKAFKSGKLEGNIKSLLETYDLDGVFFDWEYPNRSIHKQWFGDFLISLDTALGDDYAIGCAVSNWCADFPAEAIAVMDMVELMSYDLFDAEGFHATTELAKEHVQALLNLGYKPEQIDLGIPFYGHPINGEMSWYGYNGFYDKLDEQGLYHEENTGLKHHFNNPDMVYEKTAWCIEQGIGGVMSWHYSCDAPADSGYSLFEAIAQAKADAGVK